MATQSRPDEEYTKNDTRSTIVRRAQRRAQRTAANHARFARPGRKSEH